MSDNDLSSKLAKGMRRAKDPTAPSVPAAAKSAATPGAAAATANAIPPASANARSAASAVARPAPGSGSMSMQVNSRERAAARRFAEQGDQAPPASLDRPWDNLHPKRIWPD